jgi:hypothetical protein
MKFLKQEKTRSRLPVLWILASLAFAATLHATTLARLSLDQLATAADAVARVRCLSAVLEWENASIRTVTTFDVLETMKGNLPAQVTVRLPGGRVGHLTTNVDDTPKFTPGGSVILFLERSQPGGFSVAGWVEATFRLARDPRTGRELAFHRTEQALDQGSAPVEPSRKCSPHLGAHFMDAPGLLSTLGRDHTPRPELLPDVGVIPFAVEFGVGQHQTDARLLGSRFDYRGQIRTVVPRATSRDLRQQKLLIQIRHDHPLQPMPPRQRFLPVMMQASHKECADRSLRKPVASTATRARRRPFLRVPRSRRTVSPTAR